MDIEWPPFPPGGEVLGRPATEEDITAGLAAFVLRDDAGRLVGSPVKMGMPRLGFSTDGGERRLGVAVQVEATAGQCLVGVRHADGTFSICSAREFESAPRFLVLYHKPGFGLDQAEGALARELSVARRGDVLAVRWRQGPVLFVRHATGELVAQEVALIGEDHPHAEDLARCDALFEVSFLDLGEVLDESTTLCKVQWGLEDELGEGFEYLEWNGRLSSLGKG
jgi:hypothetical protein